jgi:uncharacterized protein YbjT (DUF2867 family)
MRIVMMGATGAVGTWVARTLAAMDSVECLTLLGRRPLDELTKINRVIQYGVDVLAPASYAQYLANHDVAICTVGVGQPSQLSQQEFLRVDKVAPLEFASACKAAGVKHFELLGSVGASTTSRSFYLRSKGELEFALRALNFERLSLFQPSMILTPNNRYGLLQAITLRTWPLLRPLLPSRYRGIPVHVLGTSIARNVWSPATGNVETLWWDDFHRLATPRS